MGAPNPGTARQQREVLIRTPDERSAVIP